MELQITQWTPASGAFDRYYIKSADADHGFIQIKAVRGGRDSHNGVQDETEVLDFVRGDEPVLNAVIRYAEEHKSGSIGNTLGMLACNARVCGETAKARTARKNLLIEVSIQGEKQ